MDRWRVSGVFLFLPWGRGGGWALVWCFKGPLDLPAEPATGARPAARHDPRPSACLLHGVEPSLPDPPVRAVHPVAPRIPRPDRVVGPAGRARGDPAAAGGAGGDDLSRGRAEP